MGHPLLCTTANIAKVGWIYNFIERCVRVRLREQYGHDWAKLTILGAQ